MTKSARSIITHPVGKGMSCPPLTKVENCNDFPCPVDCVLSDWSEWSECSANCGGGVRERSRPTVVEPKHDGEPCDSTEEEESCGMDACDVDCKLAEWSEWAGCTKECGTGSSRRTKEIATPKKGSGTCSGAYDDERLEFKPCNEISCKTILDRINGDFGERSTLWCSSKVDVSILIDGSGSLGWSGWLTEKYLVSALVDNLNDGSGNAMVSATVFSGPGDWDVLQACTNNASAVDMETQCKVKLISHLSNDTHALSTKIIETQWPRGTTLTSVALGVVENELKYGRADAASKVVVFTDGQPLSHFQTRSAAEKLQEKAQVIWVPIGPNAPIDLIHELASKPEGDHVIQVPDITALMYSEGFNDLINRVVTTACPEVS